MKLKKCLVVTRLLTDASTLGMAGVCMHSLLITFLFPFRLQSTSMPIDLPDKLCFLCIYDFFFFFSMSNDTFKPTHAAGSCSSINYRPNITMNLFISN